VRVEPRVLVVALLLPLGACEWFSDFKRQPSVVTWESLRPDSMVVRGSPQGSVPRTGTAVPAFAVSYGISVATLDSMASIPNPTPVTEQSLANGRKYFAINCMPCHGAKGDGTGTVTKYGYPAPSLMLDITRNRTDGYIFGKIRNGGVFMPSYNRIEEMDRWDVVNYLRALQGKVTGVPFEVGPLAPPGVTGDKLPGPTRLGPTHPAPFAMPSAPAPGGTPSARTDTGGRSRSGGGQ
jgi:mono/diheme cytochrome c family protein